ncbi:MAG: hypothetical protein AAGC85_15100 [Bacteroidota bacterium]
MMPRITSFVVFVSILVGITSAQPKVISRLEASADSFFLGEPISFTAEFRYSVGIEIFLPEETDSLSLFEWVSAGEASIQDQGPWTKSTQKLQLRSFALAAAQSATLSYGVIRVGDTSWYQVTSAPLHPKELIKGPVSDYFPKLYRGWWDISPPADYTFIVLFILAGILLVTVLILLFRKPFIRWQQRQQIKNRWSRLKHSLYRIMIGGESVDQKMYLFGQEWRRFLATRNLSLLESKSSTELAQILPTHPWLEEPEKSALLNWNLRSDEVIYADADMSTQEVEHQYETLLHILENAYSKQLKAVKKG